MGFDHDVTEEAMVEFDAASAALHRRGAGSVHDGGGA